MEGTEILDKIINYSWKIVVAILPFLLFRNWITNVVSYVGLRWNNKPYSAIGGQVKRDGYWWEVREIHLTHVKLVRRDKDDFFVYDKVCEVPTSKYVKEAMVYMEYRRPKNGHKDREEENG